MIYNIDYYELMLRLYAKSGEEIAKIRWKFINDLIKYPCRILDYGSGVGFFRAWRPDIDNMVVDSYDIGDYPQTGLPTIPFNTHYDIVCFWDVLEHLHSFDEILPILNNTDFVALTVPIKPDNIQWHDYKHFKPGEHLNYFTDESLKEVFKQYGFEFSFTAMPECPPREFIHSYIFKKIGII